MPLLHMQPFQLAVSDQGTPFRKNMPKTRAAGAQTFTDFKIEFIVGIVLVEADQNLLQPTTANPRLKW